MKSFRQNEILRLIQSHAIETQEQMLDVLRAGGIKATQATISRDIKELNLVKQMVNGVNRYVAAPKTEPHHNYSSRMQSIFRDCVVSVDLAQNIIVVHTMPGLASAAGAAVDSMGVDGLVGSLAGDDTAILIMRNNQRAESFCHELKSMLN